MARRVMVVEDEEEIPRFVRLLLTSEGYEVVTVRGGKEALAKAMLEPPDLLIADLMLPDIDGGRAMPTVPRRGLNPQHRSFS